MENSLQKFSTKSAIKHLAKSYSPLDYSHKLVDDLQNIYPENDFSKLDKRQLHEIINNLVLKSYEGEKSIKYFLFDKFKHKDIIAAYETKVLGSRVDFITINGVSTSYEIKSNLDNLEKLAKQSLDYIRAFDYNCIIIDERHLKKALQIVPPNFGIWLFKDNRRKIYRKPKKNTSIEPAVQLDLLTKKELKQFFDQTCRYSILENVSSKNINCFFKKALKKRYSERWNFIIKNSSQILPIDIQFFFKVNIHPVHIYQS
ncbi:MAG TPA: sce7726 family protein [Pelobium sp.]|nr:sce7726 family protein [Pelobium sp.]